MSDKMFIPAKYCIMIINGTNCLEVKQSNQINVKFDLSSCTYLFHFDKTVSSFISNFNVILVLKFVGQ